MVNNNIALALGLLVPASLMASSALAGGLNAPVVDVVQPVAPAPAPATQSFQSFSIYGGVTFGSNNYDIVGAGDGNFESEGFDLNLPDLGGEGIGGSIGLAYDLQPTSNLVYGLFLDYSLSNVTNDTSISAEFPDFIDFDFDYELKQKYALTIGGRVGVLPSSETLIYGLLGYTKAEWEGTLELDGDSDSYTFDNNGVTVGFGIETFVMSNVTARVEYRYTSFDDYELFSEEFEGDSVNIDLEASSQSIAAMVSYRF